MSYENRPFRRIDQHGCLAGVCAGFAYKFGFKTWIVRLFTFLLMCFSGSIVFWLYIAFALFAPEWNTDPADYPDICE